MSEGTEMVVRMTRLLARQSPDLPLPLRMCHAVVGAVEARDGAISVGLSVRGRSLMCATSIDAERFEDVQDLVHEGPTIDALRTGLAVPRLGSLDQRRRWPTLLSALETDPSTDVEAWPMRPGAALVGVLTVHRSRDDVSAGSAQHLQFLADAVGAAIVGEVPQAADRLETGVPWSDRDRVAQATGMVVAQLGIAPEDALAVLRAHAFVEAASVIEVARRVVRRELDLSGRDGS